MSSPPSAKDLLGVPLEVAGAAQVEVAHKGSGGWTMHPGPLSSGEPLAEHQVTCASGTPFSKHFIIDLCVCALMRECARAHVRASMGVNREQLVEVTSLLPPCGPGIELSSAVLAVTVFTSE